MNPITFFIISIRIIVELLTRISLVDGVNNLDQDIFARTMTWHAASDF